MFGCAAYAHTVGGKLEPRSTRCVFLGYPEGTKGYRLWDRESPGVRIIVRRDVVFNEGVFPCKGTNLDEDTTKSTEVVTRQTSTPQIEVEPTTN